MHTATFGNSDGPTDRYNADCLLTLTFDRSESNKKRRKTTISVFSVIGFLILVMAIVGLLWMRKT